MTSGDTQVQAVTPAEIVRAMDDILRDEFLVSRPSHRKICLHLAKNPNATLTEADAFALMTTPTSGNLKRILSDIRSHLRDRTADGGGITHPGPPAIKLELTDGTRQLRATIVSTAAPPLPDPPPQRRRSPLWVLIPVAVLVVMMLVIVWREVSGPPAIQLKLISPVQGEEVGRTGNVVVEASPDVRCVYVLVYPQEAVSKVWWVERPLIENAEIPGRWEGQVFYGEGDRGIGEKFTLVAQGTNEGWLLQFIRGAYLSEGEKLEIPSLRLKASEERPTVKRTR